MKPGTSLLHLHIPKTGGTYVNNYLKSKVVTDKIVAPKQTHPDFWCDYSYEELKNSLNLKNCFISTHFFTPTNCKEINPYKDHTRPVDQIEATDLFNEFQKHGWFSFTFLRNPLEQLCSMYFYAIEHKLVQVCNPEESLESFALRNPVAVIPSFWKAVDYIAELCDFNLTYFL